MRRKERVVCVFISCCAPLDHGVYHVVEQLHPSNQVVRLESERFRTLRLLE
ncbi:hypothetical protein G9A89_008878 [Geosiphon pyriformis]|nr:hypothetical protein G9A89_008878 [Geosiphon pyriformis]